jgi:hypothetical protein
MDGLADDLDIVTAVPLADVNIQAIAAALKHHSSREEKEEERKHRRHSSSQSSRSRSHSVLDILHEKTKVEERVPPLVLNSSELIGGSELA